MFDSLRIACYLYMDKQQINRSILFLCKYGEILLVTVLHIWILWLFVGQSCLENIYIYIFKYKF